MDSDVRHCFLASSHDLKNEFNKVSYAFRSKFREESEACNKKRKALCQSKCTRQTEQEQMCAPPDPGAKMTRKPDDGDSVPTGTTIR